MNELIPADQDLSTVSREELIELCAVDADLFNSTFFPRAFRQESPPFHQEINSMLDSHDRLVSLQVFRGGAKTTLLRAYTAKRIAYNLSRTILYIGKSESHALRSINWLRKQIDTNKLFADVYGLRPGDKWQDVEAEIYHGIDQEPIWIMGMGINGSVRGVLRDEFRPDLIVLDDVIDDENGSTEEQREKIKERIFGAIMESLAPASEAPHAKLVMLQTPIHRDDASQQTEHDSAWRFARFGIWTRETMDLPLHEQQSAWPQRWSDQTVRLEKKQAIQRNKLSVFTREKECRITVPELSTFLPTWLRYYEPHQLPEWGIRTLVIDPVPPPSDREIEKGLEKKDYEAISVVQRTKNDYYVAEYRANRGHDPSWTVATLFELAHRWGVRKIIVESVAYQRTLAWLIRQAMETNRVFYPIVEYTDKRSKFNRIVDALNGPASAGHLWVRSDQVDLIAQFTDYPRVSHDDILDATSIAVEDLSGIGADFEAFGGDILEGEYEELEYVPGAP